MVPSEVLGLLSLVTLEPPWRFICYDMNMDKIKPDIADRSNVFYWQTDRAIEPEEAGKIWADRHRYFTDVELVEHVNSVLVEDKLASIEPLDLNSQTSLGNVNSIRPGVLQSGEKVIVRAHPKGVLNGYFHVESAAAARVKAAGLPSFDTLAIHDYEGDDDFAFQVIEKLSGTAIKKWLETNPGDEDKLLVQIGSMMARVHQLEVSGFGPFDNERAKSGELVGLHKTFGESLRAGLVFNLDVLEKKAIISANQRPAIIRIFDDTNPLLHVEKSVLVHNDFADWNLLTDGDDVTGILDWDECVASDPVTDIACWSTFFEPARMAKFLEGYWQVAEKPTDYDAKYELLRLRYVLSKMTLRLQRYSWDPSEAVKVKIEAGKKHLAESVKYFGL
jgi:Ser/Thr protein kinase RdoA (MazF antagonist)